jgi:hypothetical protein
MSTKYFILIVKVYNIVCSNALLTPKTWQCDIATGIELQIPVFGNLANAKSVSINNHSSTSGKSINF